MSRSRDDCVTTTNEASKRRMTFKTSTNPKYKQFPTQNGKKETRECCCGLKPCQVCCLAAIAVVTFILAGIGITVGVYSTQAPLHASCHVEWSVKEPCDIVIKQLVHQILTMEGPEGCKNGGEKCLYTLVSNSTNQIKAYHLTPVKKYKDSITFDFAMKANGTCGFKGFSTSNTWYAVLDYGTNYCNMENLVKGAGLDGMPEYKETTSNSVCTQYSSANCEKY